MPINLRVAATGKRGASRRERERERGSLLLFNFTLLFFALFAPLFFAFAFFFFYCVGERLMLERIAMKALSRLLRGEERDEMREVAVGSACGRYGSWLQRPSPRLTRRLCCRHSLLHLYTIRIYSAQLHKTHTMRAPLLRRLLSYRKRACIIYIIEFCSYNFSKRII